MADALASPRPISLTRENNPRRAFLLAKLSSKPSPDEQEQKSPSLSAFLRKFSKFGPDLGEKTQPSPQRSIAPPPRIKPRLLGDVRLVFNVSGRRFETWKSTLDKLPDTFLGSTEKEAYFDDDTKEYHFNRDPEIFRYILNYYRTGQLHYPKCECIDAYDAELNFFGLSEFSISECCYEDYSEHKKQRHEQLQELLLPVLNVPTKATTLRQKMWSILDGSNESGHPLAPLCYYTTGFFIAVSVLANIAETIQCGALPGTTKILHCADRYPKVFFTIDTVCVVMFTVEYVTRLYSTPDRVRFVRSPMGLVDLVAILPYYIGLFLMSSKTEHGGFDSLFVTLRILRVFRVFKISRPSQGLRILAQTIKSCVDELGFLLLSFMLAVVMFSTFMFYAEKLMKAPVTDFKSIPEGFWFILVTMTTLGYGDMLPVTWLGKVMAGICSLSGVILITLPVTVIVSNFNRLYCQNNPDIAKSPEATLLG
ncbi:potassium voltage-gated channel protein Shal-like [Branchiostoma floridae]|uniref:Potassium voltage-gated channel protein Shal-like n=1 Tax=Branchiostoma floridae TaxID=7739 RepID=A0A9J7KLS9_BRAFL|nr:potassium voltage-gated channel protein Shal-like [Branchiostoma floridae]